MMHKALVILEYLIKSFTRWNLVHFWIIKLPSSTKLNWCGGLENIQKKKTKFYVVYAEGYAIKLFVWSHYTFANDRIFPSPLTNIAVQMKSENWIKNAIMHQITSTSNIIIWR